MKQQFIYPLILFTFIANLSEVWAVSSLSSERIFLQDTARIVFTFDAEPKNYKAVNIPKVKGLQIEGPSIQTSINTKIYNGKMMTQALYKLVFTVAAEKEGHYTIPPLSIKAGGQVYTGKTHQLEVLPAQKQGPFFQDFFGRLRSRFKKKKSVAQAKMFVSNPQPYVGQLFGAYYSVGTNIERPRVMFSPRDGQPDLTGFYSQLINAERMPKGPFIPGMPNPKVEGAAYNLIPLKVGKLTLSAHQVSIVDMERIFSDSKRIPIAPVEVIVRPLPEAGRPAGFSGTVGSFTTELITDNWPSRMDQWQEVSIDLLIEGEGGLHLLEDPQPEVAGLRLLRKERVRSELPQLPGRPTGYVQIHYRFVAEKSGRLRPGKIAFHWFNPDKDEYEKSEHKIPTLDVIARPAKVLNLSAPEGGDVNFWLVGLVVVAALIIAGTPFIRLLFQPGGKAAGSISKWTNERPAARRDSAGQILTSLCGRKSGHLLERYLRDNGFSHDEIAHLSAMQLSRLRAERGQTGFNPDKQDMERLKSIAASR